MFSFLFIGTILHTKYNHSAPSKDGMLNALSIALVLSCLVYLGGTVEGACFNPTIGITFTTMEYANNKRIADKVIKYIIAYVFGPLCASVLVGLWMLFPATLVDLEIKHNAEYDKESLNKTEDHYSVNE